MLIFRKALLSPYDTISIHLEITNNLKIGKIEIDSFLLAHRKKTKQCGFHLKSLSS